MKAFKKLLCTIITTVMLFTTVGVLPSDANVYAQTAVEPCDYLEGENIGNNSYFGNWSKPVTSYLSKTDNGYMRVQLTSDDTYITVEYYDKNFMRTSILTVPEELPLLGGFYQTDNNYFIVSGQENDEESDEVEVFRVTKYDKNWNRLGSCGLYGVNTTLPFDASSCRMDYYNGWLVVRTGHQMYTSEDDGLRHQANVTFLVDTVNMKITDEATSVSWSGTGYVSHSFNQFVKLENNKIVALDHGDAYPRAAVMINYPTDISEGSFSSWNCDVTQVVKFSGETGANYTGASLGGFEIMDSSYLVAGTSIIQDVNDPEYKTYADTENVFVAAVDKDTKEVSFNWITDYPEGDFVGTPHMVKIDDSKCLLIWSKGESVYYALVDETGAVSGEIYSKTGQLSDCAPLVDGEKVIWYTWNDSKLDFYTISLSDLSEFNVINKIYDHSYIDYTVKESTVTFTCDKCGETVSGTIPTEIDSWWRNAASEDGYYGWCPDQIDVDETYCVWVTSDDADFPEIVLEVEDPEMANISKDEYGDYIISWNYEGKAIVNIYPKYAPSKGITYEIWVGEIPISEYEEDFWLSEDTFVYNGKERKPKVEHWYLEQGTDYKVSYKNNINAGKATVVITGIGDYKGTLEKTFTINKASIAQKTVTLPYNAYHYTGKNIMPKVTIKGLTKDVDYTVEYKNNKKVGKATVTIKGKGNYKGTLYKNFSIKPKTTTVKSVTAGKKQFTVKWQQRTVQVDGYQVRYSTSKTFSSYNTVKVKGWLKGSLKVKNLKAQKQYWVKVRTYKVVNGVPYYSNWSQASKVKTK